MRNLLVFLAMALPLAAMGQSPITITQNDMPEPGDTLRYSNAFAPSIDYSSTGPNHAWDYSNLSPESQDRDDYVYSLQTAYAFYFFGVNQYGTKIADTIGQSPFEFTDVYNFYRSASQDFRAEGVGFRYGGVPLAAYYDDEDELFQFPLDYGDRDSSTYRFEADLGNGMSYSQSGYRINEVDGWGTITTPYETQNCLRLTSHTVGVDSIHYNTIHIPIPNEQLSIKFLASGVHIPILEIVLRRAQMGPYQLQQVKYRDQYRNLVAVDAHDMQAVALYPNPAMGQLTIDNPVAQVTALRMYDAKGSLVASQDLGLGLQQVDVSKLPVGMYQVALLDAEGLPLQQCKVAVVR